MTLGPGLTHTSLPLGFLASGVNCGVRRYRPDIGVLISELPAVAAAVYTLNNCQAAPILYCKKILPADDIRAIVTNSGQANAATGSQGVIDNEAMAKSIADQLKCQTRQVLTASTGVIGQRMAIEKITAAAPELILRAGNRAESFALAILTTDLVPKSVTTEVQLSTGKIRLTGISKGSGMIHPNMATMLGYILTDVVLDKNVAHTLLREATDLSFNMISVDGDTSTNDCVFLMANGASRVALKNDQDYQTFRSALFQVATILAQAIAMDGEGATKLVEVALKGAPDLQMARKAARGVIVSPLVKTAIHGEDPNWGRILARLGAEGAPTECLERMSLRLQGELLFENGQPVAFDGQAVRQKLKTNKIQIDIQWNSGTHQATAWGCDLSKKYVDINTEYPT